MSHITRYGKRMKFMMLMAMAVASFICLFAIPFVGKRLLYNEVGYYSVRINDVEIGKANSRADARLAIANVRKRLSAEYSDIVYMDLKYDVVKENSLIAERMSVDELEAAAYSSLLSCISDVNKNLVYTLRIDDYTVSLAQISDVEELLERVLAQYDTRNEYAVRFNSLGSEGRYEVSLVKADTDNNAADIVSAILNGDTAVTKEDGTVVHDGITSLEFQQNMTVSTAPADKTTVVSVDEAYKQIMETTDETIVYYAQSGDTVSEIAEKYELELENLYELNSWLEEETVLAPGQEIVVTVPKSVLTVIETRRETYEEDYMAEPEYVEDETEDRGINRIVEQGTKGRRSVTAQVTYINGKKSRVNITEQTIIEQSEPQIISVGISFSSDYVKPAESNISLGYGIENGTQHNGADWDTEEGSRVFAAADGKVVRAGWYSDYGYCVDIEHDDGSMTRYAHLSSFAVEVNKSVAKGQLIAYSGSSGNCDEPHLHFELWIDGKTVNPLNYM